MKKMNKKKCLVSVLIAMLATVCLYGCSEEKPSSPSSGNTSNITMTMSEKSLVLGVGESRQMTVEVVGSSKKATWYSANEKVAKVDQSGVVVGVGKGETRIYAEIGEDRTECVVKVEESLSGVPNFYIDYSNLTFYKGYEFALDAVLRVGAEEQEIDKDNVSWSSDKETVATVNDGIVVAVDYGTANITAKYTYEGTEYADTVSVEVSALSVLLVSAEDDFIASAKTYGGKANTAGLTTNIVLNEYADGVTTPIEDVSSYRFTSSDEEIASVENGVITAGNKAGTANIIVEKLNANGEVIMSGNTNVSVYTAINCKYDLDLLALAYARGEYNSAWGKDAKYVLTQNIDYNGDIFLPIAACIGRHFGSYVIGKQWKTILADETTYGLSYETFASRGLNAETNETVDNTVNFKFQATLNGNGYAIKNAKLMYDASGLVQDGGFGVATNMIGALGANGRVENLSVENLGIQTPTEAGYELFENYTLDGYYGSSSQTISLASNDVRGCLVGAFGYIAGGTIEDVYLDVNFASARFTAIMMANFAFGWFQSGTVNNTIVKLNYQMTGEIFGMRTDKDESGAIKGTVSDFVLIDVTAQAIQSGGAPSGLVYLQNENAFKSKVEDGTINAEAFTEWDTDLTTKPVFALKTREA